MAIQKYYDGSTWININSLAPNILGNSDPTTSTVGYIGQLYTNTTTNKMFQCTAINSDVYTWIQVGGVTSADVTAAQTQVMAGFTTITSDSNNEVVNGTLPLQAVLSTYGGTINEYDGTVV